MTFPHPPMFWCLHLWAFASSSFSLTICLTIYFASTNALLVTIPPTVVLGAATKVDFVAQSGDPASWNISNIYENGTTQIGGPFTVSGSLTYNFTREGPHFIQATAINGVQAFYTGNFFIPVSASSSTSSTSTSSLIVTVTRSCSSSAIGTGQSFSSGSTKSIDIGGIAGGVIAGVFFLATLAFFFLWRNLRKDYERYRTENEKEFMQFPVLEGSRSFVARPTKRGANNINHTLNSESSQSGFTPLVRGQNESPQLSGRFARELSQLRREVDELRFTNNVPPPVY